MNTRTKSIQGFKTVISQTVKEVFRYNQYLTYLVNGRIAYVFSPNMRNRMKNDVIHKMAHIFQKFKDDAPGSAINAIKTDSYPIHLKSDRKAADVVHNVLVSVEDQRQLEHEGIQKDTACGKKMCKAYEWYQHLYGDIEQHVYKSSLRKLVRRGIVVPTMLGTIWYKPYFNEAGVSYDFALNYDQFVQEV